MKNTRQLLEYEFHELGDDLDKELESRLVDIISEFHTTKRRAFNIWDGVQLFTKTK